MQTHIGHLVFGVQPANLGFYRDLLSFLGWSTIYDGDGMLGVGGEHGVSLWFSAPLKDVSNDYDGPGLNHLAISTKTQEDVDSVVAYMTEHGITPLFDTPRHRPDFSQSPESTYYQVLFETPDRLLIEVVYTGPKSA